MPNGYILGEGFSPYDGAPVMLVVTGMERPAKNPKTGEMLQMWVLRKDVSPDQAVKSGLDVSTCGQCELRPSLARKRSDEMGLKAGGRLPCCYVAPNYAPLAVYRTAKDGGYPPLPFYEDWGLAVGGRDVRLGAYGNPSVFPLRDTEVIAGLARNWTGYVHDWDSCDQGFAKYCMASVSSLGEKERANTLGWRTFRVTRDNDLQPDEVWCPAGDNPFRQPGKKVQCKDCHLCRGTSTKAKNIAIPDHGPTSRITQSKRRPLQLVGAS
jgi:hypothetical protein